MMILVLKIRISESYYYIVEIYENYFFKSRIIRTTIHNDAIAIIPTPSPTIKESAGLN